jgi:AcrR family transcriptional regulator
VPRYNPERRRALADAAIGLLASGGIHGLTHRAVERATGLPSGTASNYFPSRDHLLVAAAERIVELHLADMDSIDREATVGESPNPMIDLIEASLTHAVTRARDRYLAIFELQLEACRRPALREALAGLAGVAATFTTTEHAKLGLTVPSETVPTLIAFYGGALLALVTSPQDPDPITIRRFATAIVVSAIP